MGKLMNYLQKQLKSEDAKLKKDAEDCIKIYEKLKEMNNGSVWSSQWQQLATPKFKGFPSDDRTYSPTTMGYVFLKGIEEKPKEREAGVRYISVQMAIMSHLSDAQELMCMGTDKLPDANDKINFAKQLVLTYPDTSIEVSENELNEIWHKTME